MVQSYNEQDMHVTFLHFRELTGSGGLEALPQMLSKNSTLEGQRYDRGLMEQSLERREVRATLV